MTFSGHCYFGSYLLRRIFSGWYLTIMKWNRLQSDIQDPTFKICVPGRIITRSTDIRDPTLKKQNQEMTKAVSTISAYRWILYFFESWNGVELFAKVWLTDTIICFILTFNNGLKTDKFSYFRSNYWPNRIKSYNASCIWSGINKNLHFTF